MLAALAAVLVGGAVAHATTPDDASLVAPGFYNGSGNPNGGFTISNDNGIEVGLRAKYRNNANVIHSATDTYYVVPGSQTNATSGIAGPTGVAPTRAAWNYDFS